MADPAAKTRDRACADYRRLTCDLDLKRPESTWTGLLPQSLLPRTGGCAACRDTLHTLEATVQSTAWSATVSKLHASVDIRCESVEHVIRAPTQHLGFGSRQSHCLGTDIARGDMSVTCQRQLSLTLVSQDVIDSRAMGLSMYSPNIHDGVSSAGRPRRSYPRHARSCKTSDRHRKD